MGSPITSWEGVEAYFTFADSPAVIAFILILSIVATAGIIVSTFKHEAKSYEKYR